jgi:hypothetical protein
MGCEYRLGEEDDGSGLSSGPYEIPPTLNGLDAIGHCLDTGVKFNQTSWVGRAPRLYDSWFKCPMCFQPFKSEGVPDVICPNCWYEGSDELPIISLGVRKRLKPGRQSREA